MDKLNFEQITTKLEFVKMSIL